MDRLLGTTDGNWEWSGVSLLVPLYCAAVFGYAACVPCLTPNQRPSKGRRPVVAVYSALMAAFSAWCAVRMWSVTARLPLRTTACGAAFADPEFHTIVAAFTVSKLVEFADTVLLLRRGKTVSWLHYLHHIGAGVNMLGLYVAESEAVWLFVTLNGTVHAFMYAYYAAAAIGHRPPGKQVLTAGQLAQFFIGMRLYWDYDESTACHSGLRALVFWYTYAYVCMLVVLFGNFAVRQYLPTLRPKDAPLGAQMVLSTVHACVATAFGLVYLPRFWHADPAVQYECVADWEPVFAMTTLFVAFLTTDLALGVWKRTLQAEWVVHHLLFAGVAVVQLVYGRSCLPFTWLIMGEASTIFLNVRWVLIATGKSRWIGWINIPFALTFFCTRCVLYGWGLWRFLTEDPNLFVDWSVWQVTPVVFGSGYLLNLGWLYRIATLRSGAKED